MEYEQLELELVRLDAQTENELLRTALELAKVQNGLGKSTAVEIRRLGPLEAELYLFDPETKMLLRKHPDGQKLYIGQLDITKGRIVYDSH